ncbi:MAG: glycosyltransferase, partial [Coriobacteriia bacterium]|nr:glycosyltransferase [Coriobacteriia bacterium]
MAAAVSVIVPTLNEAGRLAHLLEALRMQTLPPQEVIVADAGSSDGTAELAHRAGCRVVEGGRPAVGRNYGAAAATCDVLLFLDADVVPSADFIERALDEFGATGASVATAAFEPLEAGRLNSIIAMGVNQFLQVTQSFSPHATGFCILASILHEGLRLGPEVLNPTPATISHPSERRWGRRGDALGPEGSTRVA